MFIFDYDDTLFCTSSVVPIPTISKERKLSGEERRMMEELDKLVVKQKGR